MQALLGNNYIAERAFYLTFRRQFACGQHIAQVLRETKNVSLRMTTLHLFAAQRVVW